MEAFVKRRALLVVFALPVMLGWLGTVTPAAAFDETKQGNTTGQAFVQNLYLWTGDTSRYGQVNAVYHIDIMPSTTVKARWECTAGTQGATDTMGPYLSAHSLDVNGATDGWSSTEKVLSRENTYCSYHLWVTAGAGFRVTSATIQLWNQEFVGGGPTNPTAAPGGTAGPGGSGPSPSPSPTPAPTDPPIDECASSFTIIIGDYLRPAAYPTGLYSPWTLDDIDPGCTISLETGMEYRVTGTASSGCGACSWNWAFDWEGLPTPGPGGHNWEVPITEVVDNPYPYGDGGTVTRSFETPWRVYTGAPVEAGMTFGGNGETTGWGVTFVVEIEVNDPSPDPTPTPTPSPTGSATPSCAPGFVWTGTNCGSSGTPPWYPPPPPPLAPPSTGPNLGGSGGLDGGSMSPPNSNGLAECSEDDGTFSKPGQAPLRPLNDTSFPGSINPLDYIPWVGNMVSNVPIVVGNTAQWTVNTASDWVIPGPCLSTLITDGVDDLMLKAPFSIPGDLSEMVDAELGSAGAVANPTMTIAGTTIEMPFSDMDIGIWRDIFGALVWLMGILACLKLVLGTFGVNNGGSEQ